MKFNSADPMLVRVRTAVNKLAAIIAAPRHYLPLIGQSDQTGRVHIEANDTYDFVVCERGSQLERRTTHDLSELLYWVFDSVTFSMAGEYECQNRNEDEDFRRALFAHQVRLFERLNPEWAKLKAADHMMILRDNPFSDVQ